MVMASSTGVPPSSAKIMKNFSVALITLVVCVAIVSTALLVWQTKGRMSDCTARGGVWSMPGQQCTYPVAIESAPTGTATGDHGAVETRAYTFVQPYCTKVVVGGIVGITQKCYQSGDTLPGRPLPGDQVELRIAAHNPANEGTPTNTTYQELISVPSSAVTTGTVVPQTPPTTTTVTVVVPESISDYTKRVTAYVQEGGKNPVDDTVFIQKQVTVPYTLHTVWAAAEAAAGVIPLGGGPQKASVVYMQVKDGTAYVVLNIDIDGWAGVSVALALVHPIVERTLYEFPEITQVVWGYIPGDEPE
jgi:hypothetical protein